MRKLIFTSFILALLSLPAWAGEPQEHSVEMRFDPHTGAVYFSPSRIEISTGDMVTWVNADPYHEHSVMFEPNGVPQGVKAPASPLLQGGESWSYIFETKGTWRYHCHPHYDLNMRGEVIVDHESEPRESGDDRGHHGHHGHD